MMIILEGADGSGKTSLSTRLRKELEQYTLFVRSNGPPLLDQLCDYVRWIDSISPELLLVTDRNPILSESIYGPIIRGKCMHALTLKQTASWLRNALIIHCRPSFSKLAANVHEEVQMDGVILNHRRIIEAYDKLMGELEMREVRVVRYDFTGPFSPLLRSINNYLEEQRNG